MCIVEYIMLVYILLAYKYIFIYINNKCCNKAYTTSDAEEAASERQMSVADQ